MAGTHAAAARGYTTGSRHEMNSNLAARVMAFLDAHHVMSLATVGGDGPHAANLFYARDGYALIWVSDSTSRHSRHIEERAGVAATIARDCCDFPDVQGLQVRGRAWRIAHPQEEAGRARVSRRAIRSCSASPMGNYGVRTSVRASIG
jgi:uncharacterized protein YhbP (UPF0306 family)